MTNRDSIAKTLGKRLAQKKMASDLTRWHQACRSRSGEEDVSFEGLEAITAHIDPTDFIAFNNYERNLRIFSNFALNTDTEENPWVVVNTGDRYAARKSLMKVFRSHLQVFESRGKQGCSPCTTAEKKRAPMDPLDMHAMMETKFSKSWRHSRVAWITFMILLLLAFIYAENTNWDDSWFRTPTKYNITALLEGPDDDITAADPVVPAAKKGKAGKEKTPELADPEEDSDNAPEETPKKAKAPKVAKEDKVDESPVETVETEDTA